MHGCSNEVMGISAMIEIENLSFKYSVDDDYILKNINLSVHKGECVLLCGKSGCGDNDIMMIVQ